jgi:hypothetical protein
VIDNSLCIVGTSIAGWGIAFAQFQEAAVFQTRSLPEAQISAETLARRAVALDSIDAEAHACLGQALWARGGSMACWSRRSER